MPAEQHIEHPSPPAPVILNDFTALAEAEFARFQAETDTQRLVYTQQTIGSNKLAQLVRIGQQRPGLIAAYAAYSQSALISDRDMLGDMEENYRQHIERGDFNINGIRYTEAVRTDFEHSMKKKQWYAEVFTLNSMASFLEGFEPSQSDRSDLSKWNSKRKEITPKTPNALVLYTDTEGCNRFIINHYDVPIYDLEERVGLTDLETYVLKCLLMSPEGMAGDELVRTEEFRRVAGTNSLSKSREAYRSSVTYIKEVASDFGAEDLIQGNRDTGLRLNNFVFVDARKGEIPNLGEIRRRTDEEIRLRTVLGEEGFALLDIILRGEEVTLLSDLVREAFQVSDEGKIHPDQVAEAKGLIRLFQEYNLVPDNLILELDGAGNEGLLMYTEETPHTQQTKEQYLQNILASSSTPPIMAIVREFCSSQRTAYTAGQIYDVLRTRGFTIGLSEVRMILNTAARLDPTIIIINRSNPRLARFYMGNQPLKGNRNDMRNTL